jgi:hypothetical protein
MGMSEGKQGPVVQLDNRRCHEVSRNSLTTRYTKIRAFKLRRTELLWNLKVFHSKIERRLRRRWHAELSGGKANSIAACYCVYARRVIDCRSPSPVTL